MAKKTKSQKKWTVRRLAPAGLWLAGAAALAIGILLIIKLFVFIQLYHPTSQKYIDLSLWISLAVLVVGPAFYALLAPKRVREFFAGRQARHGSNAIILMIAFLGILLMLNILVYKNPAGWTVKWDLTEDQNNTLAPETIDTLNSLPAPVHAIGFYTKSSSTGSAAKLFENYKAQSKGKFSYEFIDPNADPVKAQQYDINRDGTVVLTMQTRSEMLTYVNEQELTNAMVHLINPGSRTVYFLTGHGERDTENAADTAYTQARSTLESKSYQVKTLNLIAQNQIPEDALAVIIAGPTQTITTYEMTLLENYMAKGGSLIVLEEPTLLTDTGAAPDPLLEYLTTSWGITLNNDMVIDINSPVSKFVVIENAYGNHTITEKLQRLISFYPTARSIGTTAVENVQTSPLVHTSNNSWGETDFAGLLNNTDPVLDPSTDLTGPLTLAIAAENSTNNSRVVVIGDADFASDAAFASYANGDLLINSIDWAAKQESMISLTAKQPIERQLIIPSSLTLTLIGFAFICLLPGLVLAGGITSWLVRRSRG